MCQHTIHIETFVMYNIMWISWYASDPQNLIHTIQQDEFSSPHAPLTIDITHVKIPSMQKGAAIQRTTDN